MSPVMNTFFIFLFIFIVVFFSQGSHVYADNGTNLDEGLYTDLSELESGIAVDSVPMNTVSNESLRAKSRKFRSLTSVLNSNDTRCSGRGSFEFGRCKCRYPFAGVKCVDFACEHGLSVGARYDPESHHFNKKCICDEDWSGEYCNIPVADQCNEKGQYINGHCRCFDYYFGDSCQYVGKCINGKLSGGICACDYGWQGDYCNQIVCHHGYTSAELNYTSCICPPRHTGTFCGECKLVGLHVLPFPNCTLEIVPSHARLSREKTDGQLVSRISIICVAAGILVLLIGIMGVLRWGRKRNHADVDSKPSTVEEHDDIRELIDMGIFGRPKNREIKIHKNGFHEIDDY